MYPEEMGLVSLVGVVVSLIWLLLLSFFVWRSQNFLKKLFPKKGGDFQEKLTEVLQEMKSWPKIQQQSLKCMQKIVLQRYNPYKDTGGNQSFSIALLDGHGDGMVLTSLHSRAGTRVFAKPVKKGNEDQFQFSQEEKEVISQALSS